MNFMDENYAHANRMVARVMVVTFYLLTVVCTLNELHIFVFDRYFMIAGYVLCSATLMIPSVLIKLMGPHDGRLGYVFIVLSGLFVSILAITLSYHAIIMFTYPLALSGLYFKKRYVAIATVITAVAIIVGQTGAHFLNPLPDLNFVNVKSLVLYDILPKEMGLVSIAFLYILLTNRTSFLLRNLRRDSEMIINQQDEMVMGFATLVENRDNSTGGHIKRTSSYVELILNELWNKGIYVDQIDREFIDYMVKAAPLHDIGKITTPDSILQKPGKLTAEEFDTMKEHASAGGKIIGDIFSERTNEEYIKVAYNVANYHHEKWNGKGYPEGLKENDIPLAARIMAVADVFDAISQKRCYRDAMPLEKCFAIIQEGRGTDFDPVIVDAFMNIEDEVRKIHGQLNDAC